jgi:hypothetical protein
VKSKLESDREAKRNRDPSETPCYFFNCDYIELIYSDDSCPNFPAAETLAGHAETLAGRAVALIGPRYQAGKSSGHDLLGLYREFQY